MYYVVNILDLISIVYWFGVFLGYTLWAFYLYWVKSNKDPTIVFNMKYLHTWFVTTLIAVLQLAAELAMGNPFVSYPDLITAFIAGFTVYFAIQEVIKGILKIEQIDYFNQTP